MSPVEAAVKQAAWYIVYQHLIEGKHNKQENECQTAINC